MATHMVPCEWCGKPVPKSTSPAGRSFCCISHSVKDQHARKLLGPKVKHQKHGTRARYQKGCRCSLCNASPNTGGCRCVFCVDAHNKYMRERRANSKVARALQDILAIEQELQP